MTFELKDIASCQKAKLQLVSSFNEGDELTVLPDLASPIREKFSELIRLVVG